MQCPDCKSPENRIVYSRLGDNEKIRIRECQKCEKMWFSTEPLDRECLICRSTDWSIVEVRHYGADKKMRKRVCLECGNVEYTIERRTNRAYQPWRHTG